MPLDQALGAGAGDRQEIDGHRPRGLGYGRQRQAAHHEVPIDLGIGQQIARPIEAFVGGLQIGGAHAGCGEDQACDHQRAGIAVAQVDPPPAHGVDRGDLGVLAHHDVELFGEQARDAAQVGERPAGEGAGAGDGAVGDIGLAQRQIELAGGDGAGVGDRALGRDRGGDHARDTATAAAVAGERAGRARDGVGDQHADREIGTAGGAGADAQETQLLGVRRQCQRRRHQPGTEM